MGKDDRVAFKRALQREVTGQLQHSTNRLSRETGP
jgi:hypothetical protein